MRRRFLRGGALLAAAAGGAVAAGATSALPAAATDGVAVLAGRVNTQTVTTTLVSSTPAASALTLTNDAGAALTLTRTAKDELDLGVNALAASPYGPLVGVGYDDDQGGVTTATGYVATTDDVAAVPYPASLGLERVLDSKAKKGLGSVVRQSTSGALDKNGRLAAGEWIDVALCQVSDVSDTSSVLAAHVTVSGNGYKKDGSLTAYAPKESRGGTVTTSFLKGKTLSASTIAHVSIVGSGTSAVYAVRVYASQVAYVSVDRGYLFLIDIAGVDFDAAAVQASPKAVRRAATRRSGIVARLGARG